jgi:hypothetical protein
VMHHHIGSKSLRWIVLPRTCWEKKNWNNKQDQMRKRGSHPETGIANTIRVQGSTRSSHKNCKQDLTCDRPGMLDALYIFQSTSDLALLVDILLVP